MAHDHAAPYTARAANPTTIIIPRPSETPDPDPAAPPVKVAIGGEVPFTVGL